MVQTLLCTYRPCSAFSYRRARHRMTNAVTATLLTLSSASRRQEVHVLRGGSSGMDEISAKSMSLFQQSRMPGRCPAPTTATTRDALHACKAESLTDDGRVLPVSLCCESLLALYICFPAFPHTPLPLLQTPTSDRQL